MLRACVRASVGRQTVPPIPVPGVPPIPVPGVPPIPAQLTVAAAAAVSSGRCGASQTYRVFSVFSRSEDLVAGRLRTQHDTRKVRRYTTRRHPSLWRYVLVIESIGIFQLSVIFNGNRFLAVLRWLVKLLRIIVRFLTEVAVQC